MQSITARLAPLDPENYSDEQAELAGGRGNPRGELSIVRLLVQNPSLYRGFTHFAMHCISTNTLSNRERELVILHTCSFCKGKYDVAQHRVIAKRAGLSDADIEAAVKDGAGLSDFERTILKAAEELVKDHRIADATYATLAARYTPAQLLDFVFLVGNYAMMAMTTNTFDVKVEANIENSWKPN
jgi:4-carboxymuconolactone decarboxylase